MTSSLAKTLGLTIEEQESIKKTTGSLKSVAEFLVDVTKATEKLDFIKAIGECVPWWLSATIDSVAAAAPPVKFIATLVGKLGEIRDPDRLAYLAFTTAYQRSIEKAIISTGAPSKKIKADVNWTPQNDVDTPDEGMTFDTYSLDDPFNHKFLIQADTLLVSAMQATGYGEKEIREIQNEILMRFPSCLKGLITHPATRDKYKALADALLQGNKESRVRAAWLDHIEYQRYLFEEQRVFGEEPFALNEIYTETECGALKCEQLWDGFQGKTDKIRIGKGTSGRQLIREQELADPFNEKCGGRHNLLNSVMDLLGDSAFRDAIVIQGPAGSGKSVFTLRLATELLRNGLKPIRIRFKDIPLHSINIEDALPEAVRFWDVEQRPDDLPAARPDELFLGMSLFDQKVKFRQATICPWVLILDGWDEVSVAAQKGFAVRISEILSQVRDRFLNRVNRPLVRVILTGRPSSAVSSSPFLSKQTRLLTIRPLKPEQLGAFIHLLASKLADPLELEKASPKRFDAILKQYSREFKNRLSDNAGCFNRAQMMEVLGLPLLTHLAVRLMVRWPEDDLSPLVKNPTTLYRLLTNLTCEKGGRFGKDVYEPEMHGSDLRKLLHESAAAMTVFGRDSIPYDELDIRLSQMNEDLLERVQRITKDHPVTSLMINFFFKGGRTELGAEFLHKSFREFLFAEAVVETLKDYGSIAPSELSERSESEYWKDFDVSDVRYPLSRRLGTLLAPQWLTREVVLFIEGLLGWELSRAHGHDAGPSLGVATVELDLDGWCRVRDALADLWDWWGEGAHLRLQPLFSGKKITEWKSPYANELLKWSMPQDFAKGEIPAAARITSMDGHLGDGIFRLANYVHYYIAHRKGETQNACELKPSTVALPKVRKYQSACVKNNRNIVRFKPSGPDDKYFFNYCARINAVGWHPSIVFPSGVMVMAGIDLDNAFLALAGFASANLSGATFRHANLIGAYFRNANLANTDFSGARIEYTCFDDCNLKGALLQEEHIVDSKTRQSLPKKNTNDAKKREGGLPKSGFNKKKQTS